MSVDGFRSITTQLAWPRGTLTTAQVAGLRLADSELEAWEFCDRQEAGVRFKPRMLMRVAAALDALEAGQVRYLHDGDPAD